MSRRTYLSAIQLSSWLGKMLYVKNFATDHFLSKITWVLILIERQAFYYPKITKLLCLQRCVACEVRVNLNYSTEVHFTLFYWLKSRTWQRKSNHACAKVTWKPVEAWETTNMAANLAMEKSAFRTTLTRTIKLCNLLLKWLLV